MPDSAGYEVIGDGPDWSIRIDIAEEYREGTLKIDDCSGYRPTECTAGNAGNIDDRRSLVDTSGVERFRFNNDTEFYFPGTEYLFFIDSEEEVLAETIFEIDRSLIISEPQFESVHEGDISDKSGFSFEVTNTGAAPLWVDALYLRGDIYNTGPDGPNVPFVPEADADTAEFLESRGYYQLEPDTTERFGAAGVNNPELNDVEKVCDGSTRTAMLHLDTLSGHNIKYTMDYILQEPARKVTNGRDSYYLCEGGEIQSFERIKTN
ncbi:hypothetical protein ACFQL1_16245 [Halomicroarcula sp. GCM10025709]|uniref:hypothetical protein n=1 Tax=Halomicroarcula sp. GCM10025709 TaxID=3252669 RepID=UPI0036137650